MQEQTSAAVDGLAQTVKQEIDALLDKLEEAIAKIRHAGVRLAAAVAVAAVRLILSIPDNIAGDQD